MKNYKNLLEKAQKAYKNCVTGAEKRRLESIFPELKESEDEQHRKWILEYLYDGLRKSNEQFKDQFKAAIAWLEKQGEHTYWKPSEEQLQTLHAQLNEGAVTYPEDKRILFTLYEDLMKIMTQEEKQGEQNPAWSEENSCYYDDICEILINLINSPKSKINKDAIQKDLDWLTNVYRESQLKPAWSEEDELNFKQAIYVCHQNGYTAVENWLKSLRPKKQWKPKDYDISLLEEIARNIRTNTRPFCSEVSSLEDLIEKLKSL